MIPMSSHPQTQFSSLYSLAILILLINLCYLAQSKKSRSSGDNLIVLGGFNFEDYFQYDCPLQCDPAELKNVWFIFFYDMRSLSHENEFKTIFKELYRQMLLKGQSTNNKQQQSKFGFIDCSSQIQLCNHVVKTPLLIILSPIYSSQYIYYDGTPSMASIRSLINTHDPVTSMIVHDYQKLVTKYAQNQITGSEKSKQEIQQYFWPYHEKRQIKQMKEIEKEVRQQYKNVKNKQIDKQKAQQQQKQKKQKKDTQIKQQNKKIKKEEKIVTVDEPIKKQKQLMNEKTTKKSQKKEKESPKKPTKTESPIINKQRVLNTEQKNTQQKPKSSKKDKNEQISNKSQQEKQSVDGQSSQEQQSEETESYDSIFAFFLELIDEFQTFLRISLGIPEIILSALYYIWFTIAIILRIGVLILQLALS